MVTFGEAIKLGYQNSVNFTGHATRSEYWWWVLFVTLFSILGSVIAGVAPAAGYLVLLFALVSLPANLSIQFRRIRDAGGSIWWIFGMWGGAVAQGAFLVQAMANMALNDPASDPVANMNWPILVASAAYVICGLVTFIYTLMPSKD